MTSFFIEKKNKQKTDFKIDKNNKRIENQNKDVVKRVQVDVVCGVGNILYVKY